jgi:hypothetical protein
VIEAIHDFYLSYFPQRSQFELPAGQTNEFLHMDDYMEQCVTFGVSFSLTSAADL